MFQGIAGQEWEATYHLCKELHQAVKTKSLGITKGDSFVGNESGQRYRKAIL